MFSLPSTPAPVCGPQEKDSPELSRSFRDSYVLWAILPSGLSVERSILEDESWNGSTLPLNPDEGSGVGPTVLVKVHLL